MQFELESRYVKLARSAQPHMMPVAARLVTAEKSIAVGNNNRSTQPAARQVGLYAYRNWVGTVLSKPPRVHRAPPSIGKVSGQSAPQNWRTGRCDTHAYFKVPTQLRGNKFQYALTVTGAVDFITCRPGAESICCAIC